MNKMVCSLVNVLLNEFGNQFKRYEVLKNAIAQSQVNQYRMHYKRYLIILNDKQTGNHTIIQLLGMSNHKTSYFKARTRKLEKNILPYLLCL